MTSPLYGTLRRAAFLALSLALSLLVPLPAAGQVPPVPPSSIVVDVSLTLLSLADDIEGLHIRVNDDATPVSISATSRSRPVRYRGAPTLELARLVPTPEGPPVLMTVASTTLPVMRGKVLVLLLPNPAPGPGRPEFGMLTFEDDLDRFPPGHFRLLNGASRPLAVALGEARAILQPGEGRILDPRVANRDYCDLRILAERSGDWVLAFSSRQLHNSRLRYLAFLTDAAPGSDAVTIRVIPDLPME